MSRADALRPMHRSVLETHQRARGKPRLRINAFLFATLVSLMLDDAYTYAELAEKTGLHDSTVRAYVKALRRKRVVRVAEWKANSRGYLTVPAFQFGSGPDAKSVAKTSLQRTQAYRKRVKEAQHLAVMAGRGRYERSRNGRLRFVKETP